jgi:5-methylcytosine-specific restriction endonuclease McrA
MTTQLSTLSDEELDREARRIAQVARESTVDLLQLLMEVERRGLHLALGHSSLFIYCTRILRLSEQAAYRRITASRAAKRYPRLLQLLADGSLTLSTVGLLAPQLSDEIADSLVEAARFKSTREVERLIAVAFPQPDVPTLIRACPTRVETMSSGNGLFAPAIEQWPAPDAALPAGHPPPREAMPPAVIPPKLRTTLAAMSPGRYFLKVTVCEDTHDKLARVRALLRHSVPDGDVDAILNRALSLLLEHVARARTGVGRRPRRSRTVAGTKGRSIPAEVKREVWLRDGGRCAFAGSAGRCGETAFLEYHHVIPYAVGGPTDASNLQLHCRAHNRHEAQLYFGQAHMNSARAE